MNVAVDEASEQQSTFNSFTTGFTLGVLTGAAGYFFFATQRGTKLRRELLHEWEEAKTRLVEEGIVQHQHVSFRDFLGDMLNRFAGYTGDIIEPLREYTERTQGSARSIVESPHIKRIGRPPASSNTSRTKKTTQKFKGI